MITFPLQTVIEGLTGELKFDTEGLRSSINAELLELGASGLTKIGTWDSKYGLSISRPKDESTPHEEGSLANRTFRVLTALVSTHGSGMCLNNDLTVCRVIHMEC